METPHRLYLACAFAVAAVFTVGVTVALYQLNQIERNVDRAAAASADTLALVKTSLKGTHKNGDDGLLVLTRVFLQNSDGAANALKQTLQDTNRIAKAQEPKTLALADASIAVVQRAEGVVKGLGGAVDALTGVVGDIRTTTLPAANSAVASLNGLVSDLRPTAKASTDLVISADAVVTEMKGTVKQANNLLADPDLTATASNLAGMTANLNMAALHANNALGFIELDLTPTKLPFWRAVLSSALSQAIGIPLKYLPQAVRVVNTATPATK